MFHYFIPKEDNLIKIIKIQQSKLKIQDSLASVTWNSYILSWIGQLKGLEASRGSSCTMSYFIVLSEEP